MDEDEKEFLKEYDVQKFERPSVTVDVVIFTVINGKLKVLLIKRGQHPYSGHWALPGGFVRINESLVNAAERELKEETGLPLKDVYLEQLYTFGEPKRDPRTRVITVVYYALIDSTKAKVKFTGLEDIEGIQWMSVYDLPEKIAFDHKKIIDYALMRLRYKMEYTAVGLELLPGLFTLTELQNIYNEILNEKMDKRNFRKKILSMGIVEPTKKYRKGIHRPALLYRFVKSKQSSTFKKVKFEA